MLFLLIHGVSLGLFDCNWWFYLIIGIEWPHHSPVTRSPKGVNGQRRCRREILRTRCAVVRRECGTKGWGVLQLFTHTDTNQGATTSAGLHDGCLISISIGESGFYQSSIEIPAHVGIQRFGSRILEGLWKTPPPTLCFHINGKHPTC